MSYVTQPPRYDSPRRQPNGEPPGYLDTSQRDFPRDSDRGYIHDERGYPLDDRGYAPATRGYTGDRDFQPGDQQGYPQEFSEHGQGYGISRGGDASYDSQAMLMTHGLPSDEFIHRDVGYNGPVHSTEQPYGADRPYGGEPMSVHVRDPNDRVYSGRDYSQRTYVS